MGYACPDPAEVTLGLFDLSGARVLSARRVLSGRGALVLAPPSLPAGTYLLRIAGQGLLRSRPVLILR